MMKIVSSPTKILLAAAGLALACWGGLRTVSTGYTTTSRCEEVEVNLAHDFTVQSPQTALLVALPHARYSALKACHYPVALASSHIAPPLALGPSPRSYMLGVALRLMSTGGAMLGEAAITIPVGVVPYNSGGAQPLSEVAWSVLGVADEEKEGGEGSDAVEWYGG